MTLSWRTEKRKKVFPFNILDKDLCQNNVSAISVTFSLFFINVDKAISTTISSQASPELEVWIGNLPNRERFPVILESDAEIKRTDLECWTNLIHYSSVLLFVRNC